MLDTAKNALLNLKLEIVMSLILTSPGGQTLTTPAKSGIWQAFRCQLSKFGRIDQITHNACSLTNID